MVLPLFKVLSLVIRVFSKPLINYTKQVHLKNDATSSHPLLRKSFIKLGNSYHKMQTWVNRKFMKIQTQFAFKPLNDQLAIEKGIQFFYQIVFYSIVIGLPLYQMIQSSNQAKAKSLLLDQKLQSIDQRLEIVMKKQQERQQKRKLRKAAEQLHAVSLQAKTSQQNEPQFQGLVSTHSIKLAFPYSKNQRYHVFFQPKPQQKLQVKQKKDEVPVQQVDMKQTIIETSNLDKNNEKK